MLFYVLHSKLRKDIVIDGEGVKRNTCRYNSTYQQMYQSSETFTNDTLEPYGTFVTLVPIVRYISVSTVPTSYRTKQPFSNTHVPYSMYHVLILKSHGTTTMYPVPILRFPLPCTVYQVTCTI